MISLPVIEQITIRNYSLYPGTNGNSLTINFQDGVTVLAGINGVGKTTLLNLLMRLLLGPSSPKAAAEISRVSKRELVEPKKFDYFAKRVPKIDSSSTATLKFTVGRNTVSVTRILASLKATSVSINGRKIRFGSEVEIIENFANLSGLASPYDFHMVVRYLQFFTEERLPILWTPGTQFEFFKMLFFDESLAEELSATFASIQRTDTDYRNRRNQQTQRQERLKPQSADDIEVATLDRLTKEAEATYEEANHLYLLEYDKFHALQREAVEYGNQLSEAEVELASLEEQFAHDDAAYISQALPGLDDKLRFLMQGLGSRVGCFVCGNRGKKEFSEIGKSIRKGKCFVCNSNLTKNAKVTPITASKVSKLYQEIKDIEQAIADLKVKIKSNQDSLGASSEALNGLAEKRIRIFYDLDKLRSQRPSEGLSDQSLLRAEVDREEAALRKLDADRKMLTERYRTLMTKAQEAMDKKKESIRNRMSHYAEEFLQESVEITFDRKTPFKLATGAGKVNIPTFNVGMTSNTYKTIQKRLTPDSVSESQKEFLDLAFRMTMLDLISDGGACMMIVETPEASLDSWFMRRAATLMRTFAPEGAGQSRKLIATSNLNGTIMIPALLGLINDQGEIYRTLSKDDPHIVNLMKLTAQAKVLNRKEAKDMLFDEIEGYMHG